MSIDKISSILLIGTESAFSLTVIRALGSSFPNIPTHLLSRENGTLQSSKFSRFVSTHRYIQSDTEEELLQELKEIIKVTGANILLPMNEYYTQKLSKLKHELQGLICLPPLPENATLGCLIYKNRLAKLLCEYNFPSPVTYALSQVDPDLIPEDFFPCLLKPVRGSSGWGIQKVSEPGMLSQKTGMLNGHDYVLQEYIPGEDIDCSLLAVNGEIKAKTIQKGLSSVGFAFSTVLQFEDHPGVSELVQRLIKEIGFSGLAHLDFRLDERDGQPKLIDFNARFWHSILGSKAAGIDFTLLNCLVALGLQVEKTEFRKCIYLMGKSSFTHFNLFSSAPASTFTDFWSRMSDPLPEMIRLLN